jgi:hypothetical protein
MWRSVLLFVGLCGVLVGCSLGGGGDAASEHGRVRTTGAIVTVGGMAPGGPRPIGAALIRFVGTGDSVTVQADRNGHFALDAPPGTYKVQLVGHAPKVNGVFVKTAPDTIVVPSAKPLRLVVEIR